MSTALFSPLHNCWRIAHADRASFLVDGAAYFAAFAAAVERARHTIIVIGWDLDSRTNLLPEGHPDHLPTEFGPFMNAVVSRRRGLHAYLLGWDYSVIFTLERELLPLYKLGARTHRRVNFQLDNLHPMTASQHQKIVVIDDKVAFVGGLDLTIRRWDTRDHLAVNPLRVDPAGVPYKPFHDIQMMVDGEAARAIGELARERWYRATGESIKSPKSSDEDPWPSAVTVDVNDVDIAIARTQPQYNEYPQICEVKQLYLDMIAAARRYIYIENQYFTAASITEALAARLREPNPPEIVLVLPYGNSGWLEESTMGLLRAHSMRELKQADHAGRLRIYCAALRDVPETYCMIHSKIMVIDDHILRIGSSNLSNRSMGLDSECDLAFEGTTQASSQAIARFRNGLLAEHLGTDIDSVVQAHSKYGSLIGAIESLRGNAHSLEPLSGELPDDVELPEVILVDPERPLAPQEILAELVPLEVRKTAHRHLLRNAIVLLVIFGFTAAWQWTPLSEYLDIETVSRWTEIVATHPAGVPALLATYVFGGLILIPITLLVVATALTFNPMPAFFLALGGCLLSAATNYYVGGFLGRATVHRLAGHRLRRLNQQLIKRGLITMITIRFLPVAPFSIINLMAGALRVKFRHLILGTALGMTPGILAISTFTDGIENAIRNPSWGSVGIVAIVAGIIVFVALSIRRWLTTHGERGERGSDNKGTGRVASQRSPVAESPAPNSH